MPNSYVSNHVHVVFGTKNRAKLIPEDVQLKLWAYLGPSWRESPRPMGCTPLPLVVSR
jgi:hypothetical protein